MISGMRINVLDQNLTYSYLFLEDDNIAVRSAAAKTHTFFFAPVDPDVCGVEKFASNVYGILRPYDAPFTNFVIGQARGHSPVAI
jgi:hypothetical protein